MIGARFVVSVKKLLQRWKFRIWRYELSFAWYIRYGAIWVSGSSHDVSPAWFGVRELVGAALELSCIPSVWFVFMIPGQRDGLMGSQASRFVV